MANEITVTTQLGFTKTIGGASVSVSRIPASFNLTMTGNYYVYQMQNVATSAEALYKGDITTPGMLLIRNTDDTNYVEVGYDDSGFKPLVRLLPNGKWNLFYLTQATPQVQANTGACLIEYFLIEA
jgi:hypothetical protein